MTDQIVFSSDAEFRNFLLKKIRVTPRDIPRLLNRNKVLFFRIMDLENRYVPLLRQEMLSVGAGAAVPRDKGHDKKGKSTILLFATPDQFNDFIQRSQSRAAKIRKIGHQIKCHLEKNAQESLVFQARAKKLLCQDRIYVMGIINATPDSFYECGRYNSYDQGIAAIEDMMANKADIIDVGGESTRPGSKRISAEEELARIMPFIKYIKKKHKVLLSVDTYKSEVAREALKNGADIINDISGLRFDSRMAPLISRFRAGVVLMHIKGTPATMQKNPVYKDLMVEIKTYLKGSIKIALENGIKFDNIILDPGIGFGKTVEQNYLILNKLEELMVLARPVLIGLSRKSLIGKVLDNTPAERLTGTLALNTVGLLHGVRFLRVHDVKEHRELVRLMEFLFTQGVH